MCRTIADCYDVVKAICYGAPCYGDGVMPPNDLDSPGKRLKWAILELRRYASLAEFARRGRFHPQNIVDHCADRRGISSENAIAYARVLKISSGWLLTGEGRPDRAMIPLMGEVGAGAQVFVFADEVIEEIDAPVGAEDGDVAFIIRGDSWAPVFNEGGLLVVRPVQDFNEALFKRAVVTLSDGSRWFKTLLPGQEPGTYTLQALSGALIPNVRVTAAARLRAYIEP